jgi:hypothetical protein
VYAIDFCVFTRILERREAVITIYEPTVAAAKPGKGKAGATA